MLRSNLMQCDIVWVILEIPRMSFFLLLMTATLSHSSLFFDFSFTDNTISYCIRMSSSLTCRPDDDFGTPSLALFRCSASNWSNGFDRPSTLRLNDIWCVLQVNERVHGFILPIVTPQCFSGSYSRYLIGKIFRLRRPPLLLLPDATVFIELVGELLFDEELRVEADAAEIELCTEFDEIAGIEFIDGAVEFGGCGLHSSSAKV